MTDDGSRCGRFGGETGGSAEWLLSLFGYHDPESNDLNFSDRAPRHR
jgi:hypothetical protein